MTIKNIMIYLFVFMAASVVPHQAGWRGIVPLHATREDVERLIGPPIRPGGITYDLREERVNVGYSDVACMKGWPYGWNVPPGTVTSIEVFPKRKVKLPDLKLDLTKYAKFDNPHLQGEIHFNNLEEGLSIRTENQEDVVSIRYFPRASDQNLMCAEAAERERQTTTERASLFPVLYYSELSAEEERSRLELLLTQLRHDQAESMIYIIGYAGREACPSEALGRASRAKDWLVKMGLKNERVVTIDGGHKSAVWNEIYFVQTGHPKPLANPDIYPGDVHLLATCPDDSKRGP